MGADLLLQILKDIIPVGVVVLIGIGLFFMKDVYERQLSYFEKRMKDLEGDRNYWREEVQKAREEAQKTREEAQEIGNKFIDLIKDIPNIKNAIQTIYQNLESSVEEISIDRDDNEIKKLKEEITSLQTSIQDIGRIDQRTRNWLNDIEEFSRSRKTLAQRADEYARKNQKNPLE